MDGAWSGEDDLNPALFDLNDHFTHEAAGEALKDLQYYYPIKQLSELDNTCRMNVGFTPTEPILGLCAVPSAGGCKPPPGGCQVLNGYKWDPKLCCCNYEGLGCGY